MIRSKELTDFDARRDFATAAAALCSMLRTSSLRRSGLIKVDPKSEHRLEMEKKAWSGGFDLVDISRNKICKDRL